MDDYDGVSLDDVQEGAVLHSDIGFGDWDPDAVSVAEVMWSSRAMGRVYALRHTDPGKVVIAVDVGFCGTLTQCRVIDCEQVQIPPGIETDDDVRRAVDAELDRRGWY